MASATDRGGWARWVRPMPAEQAHEVLNGLFWLPYGAALRRYSVMLVLSVVIATMGLMLDSAAVVIGAMIIAPLMLPIMAFAAGLSLALPRRMLLAGATVLGWSAAGVGIASALTWALADPQLTDELLARTSPGVPDLVVALAAGAAGAYATVRPEISGALAGVAVAVALVPPLAAIGITLELGRLDLAAGASLLFGANLFAIALTSVAVLIVCGAVPAVRLQRAAPQVVAGAVAVVAATSAIAVPLWVNSSALANRADAQRTVTRDVVSWLDEQASLELVGIEVDGTRVVVDLAGPERPPPTADLSRQLTADLGDGVEVTVRWLPRDVVQPPGELVVLSAEVVRPIAQAWLSAAAPLDEISGIDVTEGRVTVSLAGPTIPPSSEPFLDAIEAATGIRPELVVRWAEQAAAE